jgi:hypothetical protein
MLAINKLDAGDKVAPDRERASSESRHISLLPPLSDMKLLIRASEGL